MIIYKEDCKTTLKRFPDKYVDGIITSPSYNINKIKRIFMIVVTEQYHHSDQDFITIVVGVFDSYTAAYEGAREKYNSNQQLKLLTQELEGDLWYRVITSGESVCVSFSEFELNKLK